MIENRHTETAPRGTYATLSAGFELTTRYLWLALIPVALDVFLWLGPRLNYGPLIDRLLAQTPSEALLFDPRPMLEVLAPRLNEFSYLSVPFLGVPVLMSGLSPEATPIATQVIELQSWTQWVVYLALVSFAGLVLAAVYHSLIASRVVRSADGSEHGNIATPALGSWLLRSSGRYLAFAGLFLVAVIVYLIPVVIIAGFLSLISQMLGTLFLLAALLLILWALVYLAYAPQGMILNPSGFFRAMVESVRLLRRNALPALTLLIIVLLATRVMDWLLLSADFGSWLTLASILTHAYISTALAAAMLIFYRDRYSALQAEATIQVNP